MAILNTLKTSGKAAVVALVMGSTAMVALPAQAAGPTPSFSFSFGVGNGFQPHPGVQLQFGDRDYYDYCLSNRQIVRLLSGAGYRDAQVVKEDNRHNKVIAVARKGSNWYQMRVDRCTGKVDRVTRLERRSPGVPNSSFNITLSF